MKTKLSRFAIAALMLGASTLAQATVVFDSSLGNFTENETRNSNGNYAAVLHFTQDLKVSRIGVFTSVNNDQNIKFLIFDSAFNRAGTGSLLMSDQKAFSQNSTQTFIYSDLINFTFQANHTYDVGILGSTGTLTGRWGIGDYTQDGITAISRNANFQNFGAPTTGGYSGVVPYVQLVTANVPEPVSTALFGLGLAGLAAARRKAKKTGNA